MSDLRMKNISHAYGNQQVLKGVDLTVISGELVCLLGPSGCGKTTLLRLAAGLETLQQGMISLSESVATNAAASIQIPPEDRGVGMMFQDYALFPHLTIFENIAFGLSERTKERLEWIEDALKRMDMTPHARRYPHTLSGGQQQRVALLRALAPKPTVLLLDEPFSGLDVTLRTQVREDTLDLLKESGVATLLVTHDPEEAMHMADKIMVMDHGRIIQADSPAKTYIQPANDYVAGLFGPANKVMGQVEFGQAQTPFGSFDAPGVDDGTEVQVYIRPEGIEVEPAETGDNLMDVTAVRLLGRSSHIRLCRKTDVSGPTIHLQARVPGIFRAEAGTQVNIIIDTTHAFVFPKN
jgi:iron(III) transport system ATP-binding protein